MITPLANISRSLQLMKLTDDLLEKTDRNTLRGMGIILLLEHNENKRQVIGIIHAEILKYPEQMQMIIGKELVNRVKNFE